MPEAKETHSTQSPSKLASYTPKLILAAKVTVAALAVLASLGLAFALGTIALPMFKLGSVGIAFGAVLVAPAIGIGIGGGIVAPLLAAFPHKNPLFNTTMGKVTHHNVQDCAAYLINTVALSAICGVATTIVPATIVGLGAAGLVLLFAHMPPLRF